MKKIAIGLVALAGFASLAACKSNQQAYRPAPNYSQPAYSSQPTYGQPTYGQPTGQPTYQPSRSTPPAPAPRGACGGGKCG